MCNAMMNMIINIYIYIYNMKNGWIHRNFHMLYLNMSKYIFEINFFDK